MKPNWKYIVGILVVVAIIVVPFSLLVVGGLAAKKKLQEAKESKTSTALEGESLAQNLLNKNSNPDTNLA